MNLDDRAFPADPRSPGPRPRLRASWRRSARYGLTTDEMRPVFTGSVDTGSLLYECGSEVLRGLQSTLANEPVSMMITDADGLVLSRLTEDPAIDRSLDEVSAARGPATDGMPDDLMALYERLREQKGIGAALLRARQCGGCNMTLDASELSRIRSAPADEVIRCEECQRILVRTDESGL